MTSRHDHVRPGPATPDRGESELAGVRRRMEGDEMRSDRFNSQPEVIDAEARLIAAARPATRRVMTDLAQLLGMSYDLLVKYSTGARVMQFDVLAAMQLAGDKVPEARQWCLAIARELVGRWGWTLTPPKSSGDLVDLVTRNERLASQISVGTIEDLSGDGRIDAEEAARRLPAAREASANAQQLEAALTAIAMSGDGKKGAAA